tara:strand:+ start:1917 stop:2630 length:714 start_codon:yes stop_codon:yes gene_type:complete
MKITVFTACLFFALVQRAETALVDISNLNNNSSGAFNLFTENGGNLSDPPATIFIGSFASYDDSNKGTISAAFFNDLSGLAADFNSIGSVGVEEDGLFNLTGVHDSSNPGLTVPVSDYGNNLAIWVTTSGTLNDLTAEHLIYFTTEILSADASVGPENSYQVRLRNGTGVDAGNGFLAWGGNNNYDFDWGPGAGVLPGFNTVAAVPEPSSIVTMISLGAIGFFFYRFRRRAKRPRRV